MIKFDRVIFGVKYDNYVGYDISNEEFINFKSSNWKSKKDNRCVVAHEEFEDPKEVLKFLEIEASQQLSFIARMSQINQLIKYCLTKNENINLKTFKNICIKFEYINRVYEIIGTSSFVGQNYKQIDMAVESKLLVVILSIDKQYYSDELIQQITQYVCIGKAKPITNHINLKFTWFDNSSYGSCTEIQYISQKYKTMISDNTLKYSILKIHFTDSYTNYDIQLLDKVEKITNWITATIRSLLLNNNQYQDNTITQFINELDQIRKKIPSKLKTLLVQLRTGKVKENQVNVSLELGVSKNIEERAAKNIEKVKWFEFFLNKLNMRLILSEQHLPTEPKSIVFCYNEEEKNKQLEKWKYLIGEVTTILIQDRKSVYLCNLDITPKIAVSMPEKLGISIYDGNNYKEFQNNRNVQDLIHQKPTSDQTVDNAITKTDNKYNKATVNDNKEYTNILLLGESGVGKSTFINAIFNYIAFKSFEEAENSKEIIHKIGFKFTYTDENYKVCTVNVGEDDTNECDFVGQSSTQNAKAHEIRLKNGRILRIIDTPGMGDTRGIKVDQENFKNTVEYISQFSYLNAICFLVKPNNARFGPIFKYCFKELFSNLHKNATKNIFFCFTNSRSTSYRPGDTLPALNNFLQEIKDASNVDIETDFENMFCFDNEAFRYLIITRQGLTNPNKEERETYKKSWIKSSAEANRLLDSIDLKKVLDIKDIVVVNKSKTYLLDWSKKIIEVLSDLIKCEQKVLSINSKTFEHSISHKNIKYFDRTKDNISKILNDMALVTAYLQQNSVTVFNDNFYAALTEHINELEKSEYILKTVDPTIDSFKDIRSKYKRLIGEKSKQKIEEDEYNQIVNKLMNETVIDSVDLCREINNDTL